MATDTNSTDGRKRRKTSARQTVSGKRRPATSEANRRRYQDPVQRAITAEHLRNTKGKGRPLGSYDGIRKDERIRINADAERRAEEIIKTMADKGIITNEDDPRAVAALKAAVEVMEKPANQGAKLAAARLILEYTKSKPAAKTDITVNKAEEWLAAITDENKNEEGTAGDA